MPDIVDLQTRSRMMGAVRSRNTHPELVLRKALHARGFRYRLHVAGLPGKPDIVLRQYRAVILVHGCFWHGHDCHLFRAPQTRRQFWEVKIARNRERDAEVREKLGLEGWRCLVVWECALRGRARLGPSELVNGVSDWVTTGGPAAEFKGSC